MNEIQEQTLLEFFKAVGQTDRVKILGLLASRTYSVADLADLLEMKETAVAAQIRKLQQAKLVKQTAVGHTYTYELNTNALNRLNDIILHDAIPQDFSQRVLAKYVQDGQLKEIPIDPDERQAILLWLVQDFELNRRYSYDEVKTIIAQHYKHQERLRQLLLDGRLLKRSGTTYWRPQE
jgi:biotin operon repressor